ncbi:hypothetical protein EVAR_90784_1 [Eumeta japonica]|uniref:Uncharacterized protein n=1 Tax=Eumeta variegata TaxID=151549 RepID=A0A4C1YEU7_EUMVA|nr:hypothetical protein EVAR_90784_1 [Eumeta japonica]
MLFLSLLCSPTLSLDIYITLKGLDLKSSAPAQLLMAVISNAATPLKTVETQRALQGFFSKLTSEFLTQGKFNQSLRAFEGMLSNRSWS